MTLYEINQQIAGAIQSALDPETGEITNTEALDALQVARAEKLEAYALVIKNHEAEAEAIHQEERNLAARRKQKENTAESLKSVLAQELAGEKLETARVKLSWRKSQAVEVSDWKQLPEDYLRFLEPKPDLTAIKQAIQSGQSVPGAELVERMNLQIK